MASHDLQEPLRTVASYVQLLERRYRDKLDRDAAEFIDFAAQGARRMQRLVEDLLTFSRVGTRGAPLVPIDAGAVVDSAFSNVHAAVVETGASLTRDRLPAVLADSVELEQVFTNLVSNALKFHGTSPPLVHVGATWDGTHWVFRVRDNGMGIDSDSFDRIFILFQRVHTGQEYPGTGMGLAICKKIIDRLGGRIWVESEPGHGSTFLFTLLGAGERS